jgi:ligand-binding sensor domain-containing protein
MSKLATARRLFSMFSRGIQTRFQPGFVFNRKTLIVLTISLLFVSFIGLWRIRDRAQHQLEEERARLERQNVVPFERKLRPSLASKELTVWQGFRNSRAVARFKDSYFVATDGGLVELAPSGTLLQHYSVLDGLPESDLLSLASLGAKLFIGTRTQGLVAFDGERFERYRWTDRAPQAISVLLEEANRLLIGTTAGGLIEFDGQQFREIKVGADHKRLFGINYLSKNGARLFVGTFADGLWVEQGARWSQFTVADGLLSNRILGVVANSENLFIASDYGLTVAPFSNLSAATDQTSAKSFRTIAILPSLSGMVEFGSSILLCKDDGESFALSADEDLPLLQVNRIAWNRPAGVAGCRLTVLGQEVWLLSSEGIHRAQMEELEALSKTRSLPFSPFGQIDSSQLLATNLISALRLDTQGRLWAGSFRNGIDVLLSGGKKFAHLESDDVREINFLAEDREAKTMLAATSQGLLRFNADLRAIDRWSTADGLLSNSVLQVAQTSAEAMLEDKAKGRKSIIACATSKGLSLGVPGRLRGLTTVQGLPSNSLYTLLLQGRNIYAGTLNGLVLIEDGRVIRIFNDTNSNLTPNWVTALCLVGSRLFVGTYGGGVFELTPAGEIHSFASEAGRSVVNPNAMWTDGARLYAGTLDGVVILDLHSQKWTHVTEELPSRTVLSITGDEKYVYFGTTSGIARVALAYWNPAV